MYLHPTCSTFNSPIFLQTLLLPEHVGDLDNQENFDPSSFQVVKELNGDTDRQQKISELFDQSLVSSSHQGKKRKTVEDNISEDGSL